MEKFTEKELLAAQKSIVSTIRKNEKVYETLSRKEPPRTAQMKMVSKNLKNFRAMLSTIEKSLTNDVTVNLSEDELKEVLDTIPVYIQQIEKIKPKFKEGTPQYTLAVRRIEAYYVALVLIEKDYFTIHNYNTGGYNHG